MTISSVIMLPVIIYLLNIVAKIIRKELLQRPFNYLLKKYMPTKKNDDWINFI